MSQLMPVYSCLPGFLIVILSWALSHGWNTDRTRIGFSVFHPCFIRGYSWMLFRKKYRSTCDFGRADVNRLTMIPNAKETTIP